ncbi:hypothetical protein EGW08_008558 [Elysia chlorotica]|uniref:Uncharacterized protein n=1 Tax=Elysia chlorotica TaxID=188477 RepID=A0A3S1BGX5_ELYCH|nr:hypothetical protein EGW08_008558 [Elysia chlorotica]
MPGKVLEKNPVLAGVEEVAIDASGNFKYILCRVYKDGAKEDSKLIIRGTAQAEYHADIYDHLDSSLEDIGLTCECLGGGRIDHNAAAKSIEVYGLSQGYGKADHTIAVRLLREKYPDYTTISSSDFD